MPMTAEDCFARAAECDRRAGQAVRDQGPAPGACPAVAIFGRRNRADRIAAGGRPEFACHTPLATYFRVGAAPYAQRLNFLTTR
jgi:hypothetical protein